jgi:hypothetical protein
MIRAKILVDDPAGRWKAGDEGILMEHDSEQYDFSLYLGTDVEALFGKTMLLKRQHFFYKDEVQIIQYEE